MSTPGWSVAGLLQGFVAMVSLAAAEVEPTAARPPTVVTLLFTNDLESAYDPTPAFWRDDLVTIGCYLQLALDPRTGNRLSYAGRLIEVDGTGLEPHPRVAAKLAAYRSRFPDLYEALGQSRDYLARRYYDESDLGNLFADIVREATGAEIGLMPSGALRRDLPRGAVRRVDLLDAFPFEDRLARVTVSGVLLREILEQGLSLERGLLQVSGLTVTYDDARPAGQRLLAVTVGGEPLADEQRYTVGTLEILSEGGDAYGQFLRADERTLLDRSFATALERFVVRASPLRRPAAARYLPLAEADRPVAR